MAKTLGQVIRYAMQDEIRTGNNDSAAKVTHIQLVTGLGPSGENYGTEEITWSSTSQGQQDGEVTFSYTFEGDTTVEIEGFELGSTDDDDNFTDLAEGEFPETETVELTEGDTLNITVSGIKIELAEQGS